MTLSFLLIDENENSSTHIQKCLQGDTRSKLIHHCFSITKAKLFLEKQSVDFILLDPNFTKTPAISSFNSLGITLPVVITSARTKDAIKAYDMGAFDFILKPFTRERFDLTLRRLLQQDYVKEKKNNSQASSFLEVRCDLMTEKIQYNSIEYIEAMGDYIKIVTNDRKYVVLMSMKEVNVLLPTNSFFRCHKSFIVNLDKIVNYNAKEIALSEKKIPLSRFRKNEFKEVIKST